MGFGILIWKQPFQFVQLVTCGKEGVAVSGKAREGVVCSAAGVALQHSFQKPVLLCLPRHNLAETGFKPVVSCELQSVSSWLRARDDSEDLWCCSIHLKNEAGDLCVSDTDVALEPLVSENSSQSSLTYNHLHHLKCFHYRFNSSNSSSCPDRTALSGSYIFRKP